MKSKIAVGNLVACVLLLLYVVLFFLSARRSFCVQDVETQKLEAQLLNERRLREELQYKLTDLERTAQQQIFISQKALESPDDDSASTLSPITESDEIQWSIILTGRNDAYGDNYVERLNIFLRSITYITHEFDVSAEVIITEWNPLSHTKALKDVIDKSIANNIRIITVPSSVHNTIENSNLFGVFEFIGKNVAARRAKGKWLLFTNSDNIYNEDIGRFLANHSLEENCFYRVYRIDFMGPISLDLHPQQYWNICKNTAYRVGLPGGWRYIERSQDRDIFWNEWETEGSNSSKEHSERKFPRNLIGRYNVMAAGDWSAFNTIKFVQLRGYVEEPTYGTHDSTMLMIAGLSGMCQISLLSPYATCHLEHERIQNKDLPATNAGEVWNRVLAGENPQSNDETWGLVNNVLYEHVLVDGNWKMIESIVRNKST